MTLDAYATYSANQLYKKYKNEGGTLNFTEWLNREKAKGVFPLNAKINEEVNEIISQQNKDIDMKKKVLGFPVSTLVVAGLIIVGAVVYSKYYKKG